MLLTYPLAGFDLLLGKFAAGMLPVLLLLLAGLPVILLLTVFGGVSGRTILVGSILTMASCVVSGGLALFFSCLTRKTLSAFVLASTFIGILCLTGASAVGAWTPYYRFFALLSRGRAPALSWRLLQAAASWLPLVTILLWCGSLFLRREPGTDAGLLQRLRRRRRVRPRPAPFVGGNPVCRREVGTERDLLHVWLRQLAGAGLATGAVYFYYRDALAPTDGGANAAGGFWFLCALLVAAVGMTLVAGAAAFGRERLEGRWELLRSLPLAMEEIVAGKVVGVGVKLLPLPLLLLAYGFWFAVRGSAPWWSGPLFALVAGIYGFCLLCLTGLAGRACGHVAHIAALATVLFLGGECMLGLVWSLPERAGLTGPAWRAFSAWWLLSGWPRLAAAGGVSGLQLGCDLVLHMGGHLLWAAVALGIAGRERLPLLD